MILGVGQGAWTGAGVVEFRTWLLGLLLPDGHAQWLTELHRWRGPGALGYDPVQPQ